NPRSMHITAPVLELAELGRGCVHVVHYQGFNPRPEPRLHPGRLGRVEVLEARRKQLAAELLAHADKLPVVDRATAIQLRGLRLHPLTLGLHRVASGLQRELLAQQAVPQAEERGLRIPRCPGGARFPGRALLLLARLCDRATVLIVYAERAALHQTHRSVLRQAITRRALIERAMLAPHRLEALPRGEHLRIRMQALLERMHLSLQRGQLLWNSGRELTAISG